MPVAVGNPLRLERGVVAKVDEEPAAHLAVRLQDRPASATSMLTVVLALPGELGQRLAFALPVVSVQPATQGDHPALARGVLLVEPGRTRVGPGASLADLGEGDPPGAVEGARSSVVMRCRTPPRGGPRHLPRPESCDQAGCRTDLVGAVTPASPRPPGRTMASGSSSPTAW